jgi:dTDP-4-amino-4,6-dideoxygalactose transaminase
LPDEPALLAALGRVLRSRWLTNDGETVRRLEDSLRLRLGVGFCASVCNATVGLLVGLRALELDGEVITTPFTFPATVHAIEWAGLTPVFCDIDPYTFTLDAARAADLVGPRTAGLLPVHVYGNPCDVRAIANLARKRGLAVLYDAAHAFAVHGAGAPIGSWGDLSVFSFHATKLFHSAEGGALTAATDRLRDRVRSLRNFGIVDEETVRGVGINGKMSELHAAVGVAVLDVVDEEIRQRALLASRYRERFDGVEGLDFQRLAPETVPNHAYQVVAIDGARFGLGRDGVHAALRAENIISRRYFHPLCSDNDAYRHLPSAAPERLPNARRVAARVLCLPLHGGLTLDDVDAIADTLIEIQAHAPELRRRLGG